MLRLFPFAYGLRLLRAKRTADARRHFEGLIARKYRLAAAHLQCGAACFQLGDLPAARTHLHEALTRDPSPSTVAAVLEITNWRMIASHRWFNAWPCFSPDGGAIAYTSVRKDTDHDGRLAATDRADLYLYDLARGAEKRLGDEPLHHAQPRFSPDGARLACLCTPPGGEPQLHLIDRATGRHRLLLGDGYRIKHHLFMPDGRALIASGWMPGAAVGGVFRVALADGAVTPVVQSRYECTFPDLAPDGSALAYASWRRDTDNDGIINFHDHSDIFLYSLADGTETPVTRGYNNLFPQFSSDGRYLAYLSIRRDTNGDGKIDQMDNAGLYLYDRMTGREHCLSDDDAYNKFPAFTPEGRRIVFITGRWRDRSAEAVCKLDNKGVYVTDLSGDRLERLVSERFICSRSPAVSPRGEEVVYVSWRRDTGRGVYLAPLDGRATPEQVHRFIDENL